MCFSNKKLIKTTFSTTTKHRTMTAPTDTSTTTTATQKTHSYSSLRTDKKTTVIISPSTERVQQKEASAHTTEPKAVASTTTNNERPTGPRTKNILGDANDPKAQSSGSSSFPLVTVTVALGAVLAVSVCLLLLVCYWKQRNNGKKNEKPTSLPRDTTYKTSNNNQGPEEGGFPEGVQLFNQNGGEPYVAYAVIHNNLAQQNQGPSASNEPAYASIQDENMIRRSSKKKDQDAAIPAATVNDDNSGNSVAGGKPNTEVVYASVDKSKKNNIKNESQNDNQWPSGQQVVYASVDKSKKSKSQAEDAVYAEVGSKDNTEKQQPYQITYAELADFNQNRAPEEAVKPAPYQQAEYAVIIGQKHKS